MNLNMSSVWKKPFKRLWQRVKGVKSKGKDSKLGTLGKRKSSTDCTERTGSVRSGDNSHSAEDSDDAQKHRFDSLDDSVVRDNRKSDPLVDDKDDCDSTSADESEFELLSSNRRGSLALDEILLDSNRGKRKEHRAKTPEINQTTGADDNLANSSRTYDIDRSVTHRKAVFNVSKLQDTFSGKNAAIKHVGNKHKSISTNVFLRDSEFEKNNFLDSLVKGEDFIKDSDSADKDLVEYPSILRKVVGYTEKNKNIKNTLQTNQSVPCEEYAEADVKAIIDAITRRENTQLSEQEDESDNSTIHSEVSDSSDEESECQEFDIESYVDKLIKRENETEGYSDSDDAAGNAAKNRVRKVSKKTKRVFQALSDKSSETEASPSTDDSNSDADGQEDDPRDESFEWERDVYFLADNEQISSSSEVTKKLANDDGGDIVRTLGERRAENLRWPLSIFYVKEFKQDSGIPLSEKSEVLPSYRSTVATARQPGRKRSVMQGRVWWVEWWAKEDSRRKERHKIFRNGGKSKK